MKNKSLAPDTLLAPAEARPEQLSKRASERPRVSKLSPQKRKGRRGGARNSAMRQSHGLTDKQVLRLLQATLNADQAGLPLNRMITLHWQHAGIRLDHMAKATGRYLDLISKAITRHDGHTAYIWTHENGPGKGGHCHILIHVPPRHVKRITKLQRGWIEGITKRPYKTRTILSRSIGGRLGLESTAPDQHFANLDAALSYVIKGALPDVAERFDMRRHEPGGLIIGKRCGMSQNVAPSQDRDHAIAS